MDMRQIEIDLEVNKVIENAREGFAESPNDVLRRLLNIAKPWRPEAKVPEGRPWSSKGVTLPSGTKLRMEYNGTEHSAQIDDGKWVANGKKFNGPSPAAAAVASTKAGTTPSLNGWIYWFAQLPNTTQWIWLKDLRKS